MTHEHYVSLEVAKLLRENGFDWEVNHCYTSCDSLDNSCSGYMEDLQFYHNINDGKYGGMSAPTLDVAQRWLREVKGWEAQVAYGFDEDGHKTYVTECGNPKGDMENYIMYFSTYEEALEACIKKALELILEKEE